MADNKRARLALLGLLLAVGLAVMIAYAAHKTGYHVDELYTYELANYPGGFYALQDGYLDAWQDGALFESALHPAQPFDYSIPWNNQKIDVHPPLYYCLVYTAESLLPGLGLPWVGLLPNFLCLLAGAAVLYTAARRLTGRFWVSWLAAAVFLLNVGTQGMALLTRMYALLMLETLVLVAAHLSLFCTLQSGGRPRWVWLALAAATMAGALTQYFFLVFCFFFCGLFGLWLLAQKRWRTALAYAAAEFGGLGAAYLAFPTMKDHIFGGARGQQALGSFFSLSALGDWAASVGRVLALLGGQFGGAVLWGLLLAAAGVLYKKGCRLRGGAVFAAMLALAGALYVLAINKAAPFEADRYYVMIYGPLILAGAALAARLADFYPKAEGLLVLAALAPVLAAHLTVGNDYLYTQYAGRAPALEETAALPAVVLNAAGYDVAPDLFLPEFARREAVYQVAAATDPAEGLRDAAASGALDGGFVLYGYVYDADELLALAEDALPGAQLTFLTDVARCPVYYVEMKN